MLSWLMSWEGQLLPKPPQCAMGPSQHTKYPSGPGMYSSISSQEQLWCQDLLLQQIAPITGEFCVAERHCVDKRAALIAVAYLGGSKLTGAVNDLLE